MKTDFFAVFLRCRCLAWTPIYVLAALLTTLSMNAEAKVDNCGATGWNVLEKWGPVTLTGAVKDGDVLAMQQATLALGFTVRTNDTLFVRGSFPANFSFDQTQLAAMLTTIPGLGLRVTYMRGALSGNPMPISGDGIIRSSGSLFSSQQVSPGEYSAALDFKFELVLTNAAIYNGGTLGITDGLTSLGINFSSDLTGTTCNLRPTINPVISMPGSPPPVLPSPPSPTCSFSTETLNQTVQLSPVSTGMVAANQSARESGAMGQKAFFINATNCEKDATFRVYFTDSSNQGNTGQTLGQNAASSSKNQVGVRIYYDNQTAPISFGPAPAGAVAGTNFIALSAGSTAGASVAAPFTAQYVANAGVSQAQVTGGHVEAEAIVTIVYP